MSLTRRRCDAPEAMQNRAAPTGGYCRIWRSSGLVKVSSHGRHLEALCIERDVVREARYAMKRLQPRVGSRHMLPLTVAIQDSDIVVRNLKTGHSVTYRRTPHSLMLVALDPPHDDRDTDKEQFLAEAWKAAYAKAKILGWL